MTYSLFQVVKDDFQEGELGAKDHHTKFRSHTQNIFKFYYLHVSLLWSSLEQKTIILNLDHIRKTSSSFITITLFILLFYYYYLFYFYFILLLLLNLDHIRKTSSSFITFMSVYSGAASRISGIIQPGSEKKRKYLISDASQHIHGECFKMIEICKVFSTMYFNWKTGRKTSHLFSNP